MVLFRLSAYKNFKHFWRYGAEKEWPNGATLPWAGSLASSSTRTSTIRVRPWLSSFDKLKFGYEFRAQPPPISQHSLVHILSCLPAYTLAQAKVNMGTAPIPSLS